MRGFSTFYREEEKNKGREFIAGKIGRRGAAFRRNRMSFRVTLY